jgi:hypothetical protein
MSAELLAPGRGEGATIVPRGEQCGVAQGSSAGRVPFDVEIGLELDPVG